MSAMRSESTLKEVELPGEDLSVSEVLGKQHFLRPAFGYYGAKVRLAKRIVEILPPHNAWVEVFCGSAAVTLAKVPAPIEVINDTDSEIVNVFQQLRENKEKLCEAVALTPYSREEFVEARSSLGKGDALERSRRFIVAATMTVNGVAGSMNSGFSYTDSYTRTNKEARVSRWYNMPDRLAAVAERLRSVRIEHLDALELIPKYVNRPATLLYLDPPYFADREHGYSMDAREEEFHFKLLSLVRDVSCMVLISGYESALYNRLLNKSRGWRSMSIEVTTRGTDGKDLTKTEILWMNKAFVQAQKKQQSIELSKVEKKQLKVNPVRKVKKKPSRIRGKPTSRRAVAKKKARR
jgi:DNA adenine methylase